MRSVGRGEGGRSYKWRWDSEAQETSRETREMGPPKSAGITSSDDASRGGCSVPVDRRREGRVWYSRADLWKGGCKECSWCCHEGASKVGGTRYGGSWGILIRILPSSQAGTLLQPYWAAPGPSAYGVLKYVRHPR